LFQQIWATRDMIYDQHWDTKNIIKYSLKGALLGSVFGFAGVIQFVALKGF